jgi:hypothetical protein
MKNFNFWIKGKAFLKRFYISFFIVFLAAFLAYAIFIFKRVSPDFYINSDISTIDRENKLKFFIDKLYSSKPGDTDNSKTNSDLAIVINELFEKISWYIPTSFLKGFFYYIFKDNFIIYFIKKSSFWKNKGQYLEENEKEEFFKKIKYILKNFFEEGQKRPNSKIADIAKYTDKTKIVVDKQIISPSESSTISAPNPSKKGSSWWTFFKKPKLLIFYENTLYN